MVQVLDLPVNGKTLVNLVEYDESKGTKMIPLSEILLDFKHIDSSFRNAFGKY